MPDERTIFDRFADTIAGLTSRAPFFGLCVCLVIGWAPSILILRDIDSWQLIINTATTIITFLLVALLQNSQARSFKALHVKLDRLLEGLEELPETASGALQEAVGLESRTSSKDGV
jgi:low affinity Fe/Cu permease